MATIDYTDDAERDLADIRDFLTEQVGAETAERFLAEIEAECALLARMPGLGRARPEYDPEVRSYPHGRYMIFYFPRPRGVTIARVYHSARDPDEVL